MFWFDFIRIALPLTSHVIITSDVVFDACLMGYITFSTFVIMNTLVIRFYACFMEELLLFLCINRTKAKGKSKKNVFFGIYRGCLLGWF